MRAACWLASMRPLVCTSGNLVVRGIEHPCGIDASMRPLVCTSGNLRGVWRYRFLLFGFNEAAGLHQRKRLGVAFVLYLDQVLQ